MLRYLTFFLLPLFNKLNIQPQVATTGGLHAATGKDPGEKACDWYDWEWDWWTCPAIEEDAGWAQWVWQC